MEIGAHESRGDLTVEHWCLQCPDYREFGPSSVESARRTSETFAEVYARVLAQRLRLTGDDGIEVPLVYDDEPVEVADA